MTCGDESVLSVELWSSVLSWLPVLELLRAAAVALPWRLAGHLPRAWATARLLFGETGAQRSNSFESWSDDALLKLAVRLRDVASASGATVLPQRRKGRRGRAGQFASNLEVCRYRFGHVDCWVFQYNVRTFGLLHDMDAIGLKVWPSCGVFCWFLCRDTRAPTLAGKRCLELGAGAGLLSAVLAGLGAEVVSTEGDAHCIRVLPVNLHLNGLSGRCTVASLPFGVESSKAFAAKHGRFELIVGTDLVYSLELEPLFQTVDRLLSDGGCFLLANQVREELTMVEMLRVASITGFTHESFSLPAIPKDEGLDGTRAPLTQVLLYKFFRKVTFELDAMD